MTSFHKKFPNRVGQRLMIGVLLISTALVALTAATATWLEYGRRMREVHQNIDQIQETYAKAIASSLWSFDRQQLLTQMEGLLNIPFISYVAVTGPEKTVAAVGSFRKEGVLSRGIPLTHSYRKRLVSLGTLYVQANTAPVFNKVLHGVLAVVVCQVVLIIAMALFLSLLFRNLVMRHVSVSADFFRSFDITEASRPLCLEKRRYGDELDTLQDTFNAMSEKLRKTYGDLIEAKREIQDSEQLFRAVFENAAVGIDLLDREGRFVQVNSAFCTMLGYSANELQHLDYLRVTHPEDFAASRKQVGALVQGIIGSYRMEKRYMRKDGTTMWGDVSVSALRDSEGRHKATVGIISDITERNQAEEALEERDEQYRTLFEESIDGVYSVLRDGTITDANSSFCELFGYSREEMIGKDIRELYFDPSHRPMFQKEIEKNGFVKDYEVKLQKRDRTTVDCLITSSVHFGREGSITGYRGIVRDLTERKKLHKQLLQAQKMESVGTLAGGIAHDFNNLLQVIGGYAELALFRIKEGQPGYSELHEIRRAGKSAAELTQGLLTFSRRVESNLRPVDLNEELRNINKMLTRTLPKMIEITANLDASLDMVNADPSQLQQIIMNLAVNARDAMPEGGKFVIETRNVRLDEEYCRFHLGTTPGDYVVLSVSDNGVGMDVKTREHIFDPFFTTKGVGKGTGLGLAIVFGIVKSHGGNLFCYSEPGKGTTFTIYLPAVRSEREKYPGVEAINPPGGTETILLVDDEDAVRRLGTIILNECGYSVLTAANGKEALEIFESEKDRIAMVILDLIMPEMGGRECLHQILKSAPDAKILIASGFAVNGEIDQAVEEGARASVRKPYEARQLLELIRQVLDKK